MGLAKWEQLISDQISQNGRMLFGLAYGVLRSVDAAEDVCQQALLQAWQHRDQLRDAANLRAWLSRTVINESLQWRRRAKLEVQWVQKGGAESRQVDDPSHEIEISEVVAVALEKLSEQERLVVILRIMQGMPGKDVARVLGISNATVSRQIYQALERLRDLLVVCSIREDGKP